MHALAYLLSEEAIVAMGSASYPLVRFNANEFEYTEISAVEGTELVVAGRVQIPDLIILGEDLAAVLLASGRSTITVDMPTPLLVVEVVSPGKINEDRDYRFKRTEYATRRIPEYWIVDPTKTK